ncbi:MAG: UDP-N-acetylglucosamine 1-carboxyvinyltransferase [Eubacteriales bacterium]|nr:UDP-N-acetylglucosamine 1-carboxyvinyltransferase [Eubacteriales bacterium]
MPERFLIDGGRPLRGRVQISGSKNSAVAVIPAALMLDGCCVIENVPDISDVRVLVEVLKKLGATAEYKDRNTIGIDPAGVVSHTADYEMVSRLRASYYLIGSLLARFGKAEVEFPGGCDFGFRPIDQHIKGFKAMGADIEVKGGLIRAGTTNGKLKGAQIYLDVVSVGATINLMLAAVKAQGMTIIENAAKEPHVVDTANFLNAMGADIKGAGTDTIKIRGVEKLPAGTAHCIIPDMIETGTFMIAAAATNGDVTAESVIPKHMDSLTAKLREMNINVVEGDDWIRVAGFAGEEKCLSKVSIKTLPYPGFPTDLHPQMTVLLCGVEGLSTITENIWDLRFQYVDELKRMGAKVRVEGRMAFVEGITPLSGANVRAVDLRAGASMVIAGLVASGPTFVHNASYIDRGYEDFEKKLKALGADISRLE